MLLQPAWRNQVAAAKDARHIRGLVDKCTLRKEIQNDKADGITKNLKKQANTGKIGVLPTAAMAASDEIRTKPAPVNAWTDVPELLDAIMDGADDLHIAIAAIRQLAKVAIEKLGPSEKTAAVDTLIRSALRHVDDIENLASWTQKRVADQMDQLKAADAPHAADEQRFLAAYREMDARRKSEALYYAEEIALAFPILPVSGGKS